MPASGGGGSDSSVLRRSTISSSGPARFTSARIYFSPIRAARPPTGGSGWALPRGFAPPYIRQSDLMSQRGLDQDGLIMREGSLSRVPDEFAPVVDAARRQITVAFGEQRLHSAYLYGSIPRGTAIPGVSDLDRMLALHQLLSELERHDLGFFVACLCTPLLGEDLAAHLPRYRPDSLLARETNGDLGLALARWRERAAQAATGTERKSLGRTAARRIVRTGFTLVMPRWYGWTSDLATSAQVFGDYYAGRAGQMRAAAATARTPTADPAVLRMLIDDLGPWLATEYTAHSRPEGTAPARQPLAPAQEPPVTTSDAPRPRPVTPRQAAQILAERDPVLARLRAGAGPPVFPKPTDTHFATLVRSVTYQQLAGAAARAIHGRLILALDGEVTPERLLATPAEVLRAAGLSARKAASLQDLATKVLDGTVVLDSRRLARSEEQT